MNLNKSKYRNIKCPCGSGYKVKSCPGEHGMFVYMLLYVWRNINRKSDEYPKKGEHLYFSHKELTNLELNEEVRSYIHTKSLGRQSYEAKLGYIKTDKIWDVSEYALNIDKFYKGAHVDAHIAKKCNLTPIVPRSEVYKIDVNVLIDKVMNELSDDGIRPKVIIKKGIRWDLYLRAEKMFDEVLNSSDEVKVNNPIFGYRKKILINHEPGSGKTLISLMLASKEMTSETDATIVTTSMPGTLDSAFVADLKDFAELKRVNVVKIVGDKVEILHKVKNCEGWFVLTSLPALKMSDIEDDIIPVDEREELTPEEEEAQKTAKTITSISEFSNEYDLNYKFWIADEYHHGTNTVRTKYTVDEMTNKIGRGLDTVMIIALSATAEDSIEYFGEGCYDIFNESDALEYAEELGRPSLRCISVEALLKDSEFTKKAIRNNKDLEYDVAAPGVISHIVNKMINPPEPKRSDEDLMLNEPKKHLRYGCKDGLIAGLFYIDRHNKAEKICKELEQGFPNKVAVIRDFGRHSPGASVINEQIEENRKNGLHTVIVTCGRDCTGVNIHNLTEVVFLSTCRSSKFIRQFIGRLNRKGGNDRKTVIFASHNMTIEHKNTTFELDYKLDKYKNKPNKEIQRLANERCLPPFDPYSTDFYGFNDINDLLLLVNKIRLESITGRSCKISTDNVFEMFDDIDSMLNMLDGNDQVETLKDDVNLLKSEMTGKSDIGKFSTSPTNANGSKSKSNNPKSTKSNLKKLLYIVNGILGMVWECTILEKFDIGNISDNKSIWNILKAHNKFADWKLDKCIDEVKQVTLGFAGGYLPALVGNVHSYILHSDYKEFPVLNPFARPAINKVRHTPPEKVDEVLDEMEKEEPKLFIDKDKTFLDDTCGTGMFVCQVVDRLLSNGFGLSHIRKNVFAMESEGSYVEVARNNLSLILSKHGAYLSRDDICKIIKHGDILEDEFISIPENTFWETTPPVGLENFNFNFGCVISNNPFEKPGKTGKKTQIVWDKHAVRASKFVEPNGIFVRMHPDNWRTLPENPSSTMLELNEILTTNQMFYAEFNSAEVGVKTFNARTNFDWYGVRMIPYKNPTKIKTASGIVEMDIRNKSFIPTDNIDEFYKYAAKDDEESVGASFLYSTSLYETRKKNTVVIQDEEWRLPLVYLMPLAGPKLMYTNKDIGHFGIPKLIFAKGSTYTLLDMDGEYGLTQFAYGIVDEKKNLPLIKQAIESEKFIKLIMSWVGLSDNRSCDNRGKIITPLKLLRKDFWKEFV